MSKIDATADHKKPRTEYITKNDPLNIDPVTRKQRSHSVVFLDGQEFIPVEQEFGNSGSFNVVRRFKSTAVLASGVPKLIAVKSPYTAESRQLLSARAENEIRIYKISYPEHAASIQLFETKEGIRQVIPYLEGQELLHYLYKATSIKQILFCFVLAAKELLRLKTHKIVHRDWTFRNVILKQDAEQAHSCDYEFSALSDEKLADGLNIDTRQTIRHRPSELKQNPLLPSQYNIDVFSFAYNILAPLPDEFGNNIKPWLEPFLSYLEKNSALKKVLYLGLSEDPQSRPDIQAIYDALNSAYEAAPEVDFRAICVLLENNIQASIIYAGDSEFAVKEAVWKHKFYNPQFLDLLFTFSITSPEELVVNVAKKINPEHPECSQLVSIAMGKKSFVHFKKEFTQTVFQTMTVKDIEDFTKDVVSIYNREMKLTNTNTGSPKKFLGVSVEKKSAVPVLSAVGENAASQIPSVQLNIDMKAYRQVIAEIFNGSSGDSYDTFCGDISSILLNDLNKELISAINKNNRERYQAIVSDYFNSGKITFEDAHRLLTLISKQPLQHAIQQKFRVGDLDEKQIQNLVATKKISLSYGLTLLKGLVDEKPQKEISVTELKTVIADYDSKRGWWRKNTTGRTQTMKDLAVLLAWSSAGDKKLDTKISQIFFNFIFKLSAQRVEENSMVKRLSLRKGVVENRHGFFEGSVKVCDKSTMSATEQAIDDLHGKFAAAAPAA